jgi:hypothetical protein
MAGVKCYKHAATNMSRRWRYKHATPLALQTCHAAGATNMPRRWRYKHAAPLAL